LTLLHFQCRPPSKKGLIFVQKTETITVDSIFSAIVRSLRADEKVEIRRFGSFRIRQRKPRTGRNPKTGTTVSVPPKKIPYFKPSKELKDALMTTTVPGS